MAETKVDAAQFFKTMGDIVSDNRKELTQDKGVPGTDMGMFELLKLKSSFNEFEMVCVAKLAEGQTCTTAFNTSGGKRLDVSVSLSQGVDVTITAPETQKIRKVSFRPPASGEAKP